MWSASMLVTTASTGCRYRNDASDSSASTTMNSPLPSFACEPAASSRPPITKVGSMPASASTLATRLVVVVLPCVPATAMPCRSRISSASISARGTTGMRLRARRADLRVVGLHRGGHHHRVGALHLRGVVPAEHLRAQLAQALGGRVLGQVRAAHLDSPG